MEEYLPLDRVILRVHVPVLHGGEGPRRGKDGEKDGEEDELDGGEAGVRLRGLPGCRGAGRGEAPERRPRARDRAKRREHGEEERPGEERAEPLVDAEDGQSIRGRSRRECENPPFPPLRAGGDEDGQAVPRD